MVIPTLITCTDSKSPGGEGGTGASDPEARAAERAEVKVLWDWAGVVGTGQSLAVGTKPITSTEQRYKNLKLSLGTASVPPFDPQDESLAMVPLVEPIHGVANDYPSPYPNNVWGETLHCAMGNQISWLVKDIAGLDYVTAHTVVGESGQPMSVIQKGATDTGEVGRAYAATLFEVQAIARLAKAEDKTYGVGAIVLTHGESDCGSSTYAKGTVKLWSDYNRDLRKLTGQRETIPLFVSQQHSHPTTGGTSIATLAQWRLGLEHAKDILCTGPKYQYPYGSDGIHLTATGYQQLGEKLGQIFYQKVVVGRDWQPLQPTRVTRDGRVVTIQFQVPVPPLAWDDELPEPTLWEKGHGFELRAGQTMVPIASVEIDGDSVIVTAAGDLPDRNLKVGYAMCGSSQPMSQGTFRWGKLRDSDPFVGSTTGHAQPNYCVAFELEVP